MSVGVGRENASVGAGGVNVGVGKANAWGVSVTKGMTSDVAAGDIISTEKLQASNNNAFNVRTMIGRYQIRRFIGLSLSIMIGGLASIVGISTREYV
jgi:hypothetical protein